MTIVSNEVLSLGYLVWAMPWLLTDEIIGNVCVRISICVFYAFQWL